MHAAFILIVAETGTPFSVAEEVSKIKNVEIVHPVTGPYDVIAYLEAEEELADNLKDIAEEIHGINGVLETLTHVAVH